MKMFSIPAAIELSINSPGGDPCFAYAVAEITRLLKKSSVEVLVGATSEDSPLYIMFLGRPGEPVPPTERFPALLFPDAYSISVLSRGVWIVAKTAKGILNGVYDLAERLGFAFLVPGEEGEWAPDICRSLPVRRTVSNPRFRYRGVQYGGLTHDYELNEWLIFYTKLRFNAVCLHGPVLEDTGLARRLGLRLETGGHGYRELLPRKLFDRKPDLFRMMQPEDFGGKRVADYNSCAANPEARKIMRESYRKETLQANEEGYYSLHRWPDDLPGGGWCLCPHCRCIAPSDQAMLAMRNLGEVVREERLPMRVAMVAYHDTMLPAWDISPTKETFLLFAARERCYGHRLSDPNCARNRFYMRALVEWMKKYQGIDDAHTCEYYFDQILFRGLHPYIPDVIAGDSEDYERGGIESHIVLHIGGTSVAPDWNMVFFAHNVWDPQPPIKTFHKEFPLSFCQGAMARSWSRYLDARARIFTKVLRMCDYEIPVYLDYRWLPGTTKLFGQKMADLYRKSSMQLELVATKLEKSVSSKDSVRLRGLAAVEVARARFEAAELAVMAHQQDSVNQAMRYLVESNPAALRAAISAGEKAIQAFQPSRALAKKAGISEKCWYFRNINRWLSEETKRKIKVWKKGLQIHDGA